MNTAPVRGYEPHGCITASLLSTTAIMKETSINCWRFDKLGDAILLSVHVLANTYENESVFRSFVHRVMIEHFARNIDPPLWKTFWECWTAFLTTKGADLSPEQELAWHALGTRFNEEAQSYLAKVGRPHT